MKIPKISVCVVAKNAAGTTRHLFNSLKEFADRGGDMVLVDTGSTDGTQTIYRAFGFRVFDEGDRFRITIPTEAVDAINSDSLEFNESKIVEPGASLFSFADARNYAAEQAKNDYILNPDADEELTVFDIDAVEEKFKTITRFRYDFVFDHKPDGSPGVFFVTDTRASDRRYWRWKGHVHETNEPIAPGATMEYVPPSILKIEHWQVPSPTRTSYLPGLAYACYLEPKNDRNLHYYGRELMYRGYYRTAIKKLTQHLSVSQWSAEKGQSLIFIGDSYMALGEEKMALDSYLGATEEDPTRREAWLRLAKYYFSKGKHYQVASYASAALALPKVDYYGNTTDSYTSLPHHYLYWAYQRMGQQQKAQEHWSMALSYDPESEAFRYDAKFFRRMP